MQQFDTVKSSHSSTGPMNATQDFVRHWLSGRRGLIIGGLVVIAGLALGWNWLSAIGIAPVILSLAPCAVMCAIGACAMRRDNSACSKSGAADAAKPAESTSDFVRSREQR
jgi:hypothetical protein